MNSIAHLPEKATSFGCTSRHWVYNFRPSVETNARAARCQRGGSCLGTQCFCTRNAEAGFPVAVIRPNKHRRTLNGNLERWVLVRADDGSTGAGGGAAAF